MTPRRIALLVVACACGHAAEAWQVVPARSVVRFSGHTSIADFHGTAAVAGGVLDLDPAHPGGWVEVDAASMDTGGERRDERMHAEVMRSGEFSRVRFDLRALEVGAAGIVARGTWTMRGVSREIAVPVHLEPGRQQKATASFVLDIRRWSIDPPRLLVVTVDHDVRVDLELCLAPIDGIAPRIDRGISGTVANGADGTPVDLAAASRGRVAVIFSPAGAADAAAWCARLDQAGVPRLALRQGGVPAPAGPAGALIDERGEVAVRLRLPECRVQALVFDDAGELVDSFAGAPLPGVVERAARLAMPAPAAQPTTAGAR